MTRGALIGFEWAAARRGRVVLFFAIGFALASIGVSLAGLSAGGIIAVQGFSRTSVSLLQLVLWTVPLLALLLGAIHGAECYELEFLAGLPAPRSSLVFGRWAAWTAALGTALIGGFGAAGVVIGLFAGAADVLRYLALVGISLLLLSAGLALGLWIGVAAGTRPRAIGAAVIVWFVLAIGLDLTAIAVLAVLPATGATWNLAVLLLANPVDSARALALGVFSADALAGPTGASLRHLLGGWGVLPLTLSLAVWTAGPLYIAGKTFNNKDL
ncbi:MAG TPA: ABC transporter permease subunit [Gemmatimonadales bacterium]|nr:ABC transporter permease subunit [Gemmatimonadales bacterium]